MLRLWMICLCVGLSACASTTPEGASRDGPSLARCAVEMSQLDELEHRASWRAFAPHVALSLEREMRPGFDASWARPVRGPERVHRVPAWRHDLIAVASLRWELDAVVVAPAALAAVRARRARVLGRGACRGDHHVW